MLANKILKTLKKDGKSCKTKEESERNATALNPQCENDAIREDKIKENKKIERPSLENCARF